MNKAILIGNLTKDPEMKTTQTGISKTTFTLAVSRRAKDEADFIPIVTWRGLAENCAKYLAKGRKVAICGAIQTRTYETPSGEKKYVTEVIADDVEFLSKSDKGKEETINNDLAAGVVSQDFEVINDNDLPF